MEETPRGAAPQPIRQQADDPSATSLARRVSLIGTDTAAVHAVRGELEQWREKERARADDTAEQRLTRLRSAAEEEDAFLRRESMLAFERAEAKRQLVSLERTAELWLQSEKERVLSNTFGAEQRLRADAEEREWDRQQLARIERDNRHIRRSASRTRRRVSRVEVSWGRRRLTNWLRPEASLNHIRTRLRRSRGAAESARRTGGASSRRDAAASAGPTDAASPAAAARPTSHADRQAAGWR